MKTGMLRKETGFWKRLSFTGNVCKMRKALLKYLEGEGMKCEVIDGDVAFDYDESHFCASFESHEGFVECEISYTCNDDDYEHLEESNKTFLADKINTDMLNHATVLAFGGKFAVRTFFYFTNKETMINLFSMHFEELTDSLDMVTELVNKMIKDNKKWHCRRIGFYSDASDDDRSETKELQVAAKA